MGQSVTLKCEQITTLPKGLLGESGLGGLVPRLRRSRQDAYFEALPPGDAGPSAGAGRAGAVHHWSLGTTLGCSGSPS